MSRLNNGPQRRAEPDTKTKDPDRMAEPREMDLP